MARSFEERIEQLKDLIATQCDNGNWDYDEYMFGMANGMILALSVIEESDPQFLNAPELFIYQRKLIDRLNESRIIVDKGE